MDIWTLPTCIIRWDSCSYDTYEDFSISLSWNCTLQQTNMHVLSIQAALGSTNSIRLHWRNGLLSDQRIGLCICQRCTSSIFHITVFVSSSVLQTIRTIGAPNWRRQKKPKRKNSVYLWINSLSKHNQRVRHGISSENGHHFNFCIKFWVCLSVGFESQAKFTVQSF